jgi:hypothetical protein
MEPLAVRRLLFDVTRNAAYSYDHQQRAGEITMDRDENYDPELETAWIDAVVSEIGCTEDRARELLNANDWDIADAVQAGRG